jgi:RNA polymerase sigma-70 factor (ECF subfamily)
LTATDGRDVTDDDGFRDFYQAVFRRLVGQLFLVTGDVHEAEDVVQEALARAAVRWDRLASYDLPEAWVRRVALNLSASRARNLRRRALVLAGLTPPALPDASEDALALADALRRLPVRQRQAIVLHHLLDMSVEEVARTLSVPAGTVKSWLARGRKALGALLADDHGTEEVPSSHG